MGVIDGLKNNVAGKGLDCAGSCFLSGETGEASLGKKTHVQKPGWGREVVRGNTASAPHARPYKDS
jgi:hypothetical protein